MITRSPSLTGGGTVYGDITITGDLKVEGGGSFTYDEIIEGNIIIDQDSNVVALTIDTEATTAYGFHINNPAQTTNAVFAITPKNLYLKNI